MKLRWIVLGVALLCVAEVWSKPADKEDIDDTINNDEAEDNEADDYDENESQNSETEPIQVITQSQYFKVPPGSDVFLPCQFLHADNVMISWNKGSELLYAGDSKISGNERIEKMKNNSLVIRGVKPEDSSDNYFCKAVANDPKIIVHHLQVGEVTDEVRVSPRDNVDITQGEDIEIGCEINSTIKPNRIAWSREGFRLKPHHQNDTGIYLFIHNATRHVAGDYQCLVDTGSANPTVKHLKLKVKHVPEIEYEKEQIGERFRNRETYYTGLGVETNITCIIHSHPPVTKVIWLKDNHKLKPDGRISKSDNPRTHHTLTIHNTTAADLGVYQCRAWNDLGSSSGPLITVTDTPDQPIFKHGQPVDDSIQLQWRVNSCKPIVENEFLYRKEGETDWQIGTIVKVVSSIDKVHIVQGTITGIAAGNHEAKLRSRNDELHPNAGWGPYSEIKKFDGEYQNDSDAASVRGSSMKASVSFMSLLMIVLPLAYSCL